MRKIVLDLPMTLRYSKIVMSLCLSALVALVVLNNTTDYGSNFGFVQHVMSMDTIFPDNALMYRSITTPALWHASYWLIIFFEALIALTFLLAALKLWQVRHGTGKEFNDAKSLVVVGTTLGFLVWFLGFMAIGGEWYVMWQSKTWNGQGAAFKFYMSMLAVLIFVNQPDQDLN